MEQTKPKYECCANCKHHRDAFTSTNTWDALYYCVIKEEIYLWNWYNHCCDKYEPNLHDHLCAQSSL